MAHFTCNFISYTLRRAVNINVILPSMTCGEAEKNGASHKVKAKYPVLYLLHGYGNDNSTWERYTSIERYAEERQIAVVTFSGENNFYLELSQFSEIKGQERLFAPDYRAFIQKELPEFVTSVFPISNKRADKFIAGLSMGGFGAMCNGFSKPEAYCAVGAFSPLPTLCTSDYGNFSLLSSAQSKNEPYLLIEKAVKKGKKVPAFYYSYGNKDFLLDKQVWFKKALDELGIAYHFNNSEDLGHEWAFWDQEVRNFLDWIPRSDVYYKENPKRNI